MPTDEEWIGCCVRGRLVVMRLYRDHAHRVDQWAAEIDGEVVETAAGLTDLFDLLRKAIGKPMSRRALSALQHGYSARDEADAMAA